MSANTFRGRKSQQGGFTLVELLVVIGVISILAGMLLPVLESAVATAEQVSCMSNQNQIGKLFIMYASDNSSYFPPFNYSIFENDLGGTWPTKQKWNWGYGMRESGYIDDPRIFQCPTGVKEFTYKHSVGIDDVVHRPDHSTSYLYIHYGYNYAFIGSSSQVYPGTPGDDHTPAKAYQIKKPGHTILTGESCIDKYSNNTYRGIYQLYYNGVGINDFHAGGINILWVDSHVSYLSDAPFELDGTGESKRKYFTRD